MRKLRVGIVFGLLLCMGWQQAYAQRGGNRYRRDDDHHRHKQFYETDLFKYGLGAIIGYQYRRYEERRSRSREERNYSGPTWYYERMENRPYYRSDERPYRYHRQTFSFERVSSPCTCQCEAR